MLNVRSDAAWEKYGEVDPYFGVVSHEKFRSDRLDGSAYEEFFRSGEEHVEAVLRTIREHLDPGFRPERVLDFGCGVGRLLVPLARTGAAAVGVDVSEGMLKEARKNCDAFSLGGVELVRSDDRLSRVEGSFDFVHSYIVFQHVPPRRGVAILRALVERLREGGVGALHFTYARRAPRVRRTVNWMRRNVPLVNQVVNLAQRRPLLYPLMQMHNYRLDRIFRVLQETGCHHSYVRFTDHGGHLGVMLYFQKRALPSAP